MVGVILSGETVNSQLHDQIQMWLTFEDVFQWNNILMFYSEKQKNKNKKHSKTQQLTDSKMFEDPKIILKRS